MKQHSTTLDLFEIEEVQNELQDRIQSVYKSSGGRWSNVNQQNSQRTFGELSARSKDVNS